MKIGDVVAEFESGRAGVHSISSGRGDPGGKSYGKYQLASRVGTLQAWIRRSAYKEQLSKYRPASSGFDRIYRQLAKEDPTGLEKDQHAFIKRTHFDPARKIADEFSIPSTPAINEFVWSASVQHSRKGVRRILSRANLEGSEGQLLDSLFASRKRYVRGIRALPSATRNSVLRRYDRELRKIRRVIGVAD